MAKVTGTKKETSSTSNLKDTLKKIRKFTPMGMTVEIAKTAAKKLKTDSKGDTARDRLKQPLKKQAPKKLPPFNKFDKKPKYERMPLPRDPKKQPRFERMPMDPNKKPKFEFLNKGGRAGFKSGSKGCKLAMKGKGRAYGKNS